MVVVTIEHHPDGDATRARQLGRIEILNDGTGTAERFNYDVFLRRPGEVGAFNSAKVCGHPRGLSPFHLVLRCLEGALSRFNWR